MSKRVKQQLMAFTVCTLILYAIVGMTQAASSSPVIMSEISEDNDIVSSNVVTNSTVLANCTIIFDNSTTVIEFEEGYWFNAPVNTTTINSNTTIIYNWTFYDAKKGTEVGEFQDAYNFTVISDVTMNITVNMQQNQNQSQTNIVDIDFISNAPPGPVIYENENEWTEVFQQRWYITCAVLGAILIGLVIIGTQVKDLSIRKRY